MQFNTSVSSTQLSPTLRWRITGVNINTERSPTHFSRWTPYSYLLVMSLIRNKCEVDSLHREDGGSRFPKKIWYLITWPYIPEKGNLYFLFLLIYVFSYVLTSLFTFKFCLQNHAYLFTCLSLYLFIYFYISLLFNFTINSWFPLFPSAL